MKNKITSRKSFLRNDIILIATLLIFSCIGIIFLFFFKDDGTSVKVTVDGNLYGVYSLSNNHIEFIHIGKDNTNSNKLVIKDGVAFMEAATCPDGICVNHSPIHREGESIICLPNRVVVSVITENNDTDIVA